MAYYFVQDDFNSPWDINGDLNWLIIHHSCELINND